MFGRSRPVVFDPYRHQRRRGGLPRWAWLLLTGLAIGAGGVILAQERWLPPRLSAAESARLRSAFEQAEAERNRLQQTLTATTRERDEARSARDALVKERDDLAARVEAFDADLAFAVDGLPPDPREGAVALRAVQASARQGALHYAVALSHGQPGGRAIDGVLQLEVSGQAADGSERRVTLQPVERSIAPREVMRGSVPLPSGFRPSQATMRVVDRKSGQRLGMRIALVR
jgi:hypothetical protein